MNKTSFKGNLTIYPTPVVLVSCGRPQERPNIITLAWAGVVCSSPEMVSISIRPERYSFPIIAETGEFVVNIPRADQLKSVDLCGIKSGREVDKFKMCGFSEEKCRQVTAPMISQCPVNLECKVRHLIELGAHTMFVGEIVAKHIDEDCIDEKGFPVGGKLTPLCFIPPDYYRVEPIAVGNYGFSAKS